MTKTHLRRRLIITMVLLAPAILMFQNCSSSHGTGELNSASTGNGIIQTTCIPANQNVVNANQQAALALVQSKWPTPPAGSAEANAVPDIVSCVQTNGAQGCPGEVSANQPQNSDLYQKVVDGIWPVGGSQYSASDIATLRDWILGPQVSCDTLAAGTGNPNSGGGGGSGANTATFTQVNNQIIQQYCVGCHGNGGISPNLTTYGNVAASASACLSAIQPGGNMPLGQPPLSQSLQTLFANWVNGGAKND